MKKLFILAIIILVLSGVSKKIGAQAYVLTYPLSDSVAKKADGLKNFFQKDKMIKCYDLNQITILEMKCRSDSTFIIYFPVYSDDGRRTDYFPIISLYQRHGNWLTDKTPMNGKNYDQKESKSQAKIISQAIKFLSSKKFNPPGED
ncbi:MAG: hypothetical protein ACYC40_00680 [Patescibacteria group bacterium]